MRQFDNIVPLGASDLLKKVAIAANSLAASLSSFYFQAQEQIILTMCVKITTPAGYYCLCKMLSTLHPVIYQLLCN
ncbi:hypothetical protein BW691_25870 [Escherichia coli]|nr:hypothetical protein BW691_25870 [Escherichia coli]